MTLAPTSPICGPSPGALLNPNTVSQILGKDSGIEWPGKAVVEDVRAERVWPTRDGHFVFEWSFGLGKLGRHVIFGETLERLDEVRSEASRCPRLTPDGIRDVLVVVPRWNVQLFTPDRDPALPHLARCLDANGMVEQLAPFWKEEVDGDRESPRSIVCRPLGYRAGKRAAILYEETSPGASLRRLVGKTYCDDRADRLRRRHTDLDELLAAASNGRVRAALPIGGIPALHMVLFAWSVENPDCEMSAEGGTHDKTHAACDRTMAGVQALIALHSVSMEGLPDFSAEDERKVVNRWHSALSRLAPDLAEVTEPLVTSLNEAAGSVVSDRTGTLHRDFYERQFVRHGSTTELLDLDTLARGDPSVDLGNYLTHLILARWQSDNGDGDVAGSLVQAYMDRGGALRRGSFGFYWASSLFRVGAVHALRARTKSYSPSLWKLAGDVLKCLGCETAIQGLPGTQFRAMADARDVLEMIPS